MKRRGLATLLSIALIAGQAIYVQAEQGTTDTGLPDVLQSVSGGDAAGGSSVSGGDAAGTGGGSSVSGGDAAGSGGNVPGTGGDVVQTPEIEYDVWWDFEDAIWEPVGIGKSVIAEGGTSPATLSKIAESESNSYMNLYGSGKGKYRVARLDVDGPEAATTTVNFDWLPKYSQDNGMRFGDISFYSSANDYAFFGLQFDKNREIKYYTIGENVESGYAFSYSEEELNGGFKRNSDVASGTAAVTGIVADGATWYTVDIVFDHFEHTADLVIADRDSAEILYEQSNIPIYASAADLAFIGAGAWKAEIEMGIDNLGIKYDTEVPAKYYYNMYWNDFEEGIWEGAALDKKVIFHNGAPNMTHETAADGNKYMKLASTKSGGYRVAKLTVSDEAAEKAEVTFDWLPINIQDKSSRFGDVSFYTTDNTFAYFGLQFDKDKRIKYYTMGENIDADWNLIYSSETLTGGIKRNAEVGSGTALDTGITADGSTWYTINVVFDYNTHTAKLTIVNREVPDEVLYQAENIPIYTSAVNVSLMAAGGWKSVADMGIDNVGVKYEFSDAGTIVSVAQPENVSLLAGEWEAHVAARPTRAVVTMGDNSTLEVGIGEWSSEPAFDPAVYTEYTWTAPLVVPEGLRNPKELVLSYKVDYIKNYEVKGAYDPTTLEMKFGNIASVEEFEAMRPTKTQVVLSNGTLAWAELDATTWEAINAPVPSGQVDPSLIPEVAPEFDPAKDGIYVYQVKLATNGTYAVKEDIWVQWRVNYYVTGDNFNGYDRGVENVDRGLYALKNSVYDSASGTYVDSEQGGIFLSWRVLVDEYEQVSNGVDITFEVYRNGEKIATLTNSTNYLDENGEVGDIYSVKAIQKGVYSFSKEVKAQENNYISVKLQRPLPAYGAVDNLAIYRINDTEVADVDGDNEYELIVKWYPSNGFDAGKAASPSSPHVIDVYEMNGTALWRLFMGYSSPAGQHFDNFMVYDLDNDGKAELSILTQDGTRTYRPDENGQFAYVTTTEGGYVFQPNNTADSESDGSYVLSADGNGYVLSDTELLYVGNLGSPIMDDRYLIDVVGDRSKEGIGILDNGHKAVDGSIAEYFTVFNGATGEAIDTVDYYYNSKVIHSLFVEIWGEDAHLSTRDRFNIGIATIPTDINDENCTTTIPAVICNRAYYGEMSHVAYTLVDGKIQTAWKTFIDNAAQGGGNHNLATGDVDNDGFDEIYMGGTTIDHDGTVLWAKDGLENRDFMKHGDAIHMTAVFPGNDQLYVFTPVEDKSVSSIINYALTNGANGGRVVGHGFGQADTGRGMLANVTPSAGYELWTSNGGNSDGRYPKALYNACGEVVSEKRPNVQTWASYWDGDLLSELPDTNPTGGGDKSGLPMGVHKYNWETGMTETIASFAGTWSNNSTKNNPCLVADILGDWREEILVRSADNEELRIYMTNISTDYMIYTLMQDPVYRNSVANQNTTYNQPTHTSFYLGEDEEGRNRVLNFELPVYEYSYTTEGVAKYTDIRFVTNQSVQVDTLEQVKLGSRITAPEASVDGYSLEGWYLDEELTLKWNFVENIVESNMTLYAKWTENVDDNTGDDSTGDDNTGDDSIGDDNTGDDSAGDDNTGDDSIGDASAGDDNTEDEPAEETDEDVQEPVAEYLFDDNSWQGVLSGVQDIITQEKPKKELTNYNIFTGLNTQVPTRVLQLLEHKNITLAMHCGEGLTLSVSGTDVTPLAMKKGIDLRTYRSNTMLAGVMQQKIADAVDSKLFSFVHQNAFGMVVNLHVSAGTENAGNYANLYHFNKLTGILEYQGSYRVIANGQAMFGLTRGGEYLVTITNNRPLEKAMNEQYTVVKGDTLYAIARKYGMDLDKLLKLNERIENPDKIRAGQKVNVR